MKRTFVVLTIGALALASHATEVVLGKTEPALVEVVSIPSKVTVEGAVPISLAEVDKAAKEHQKPSEEELEEKIHELEDRMDGELKMNKRFWHSEETTTHAPGWGWPAPAHPGWGPPPEHGSPGLVGPFAFQLGAYYNPYLPQHPPNQPAYGSNRGYGYSTPAPYTHHPPSYTSPSPSYPASYGHSYTTPAPYTSSYGSSYTTPAPSYSSSSYGSSYSTPAPSYSSPSYGSTYTTPAPSYGSSYSAPSANSYGYSGSAPSYSASNSYGYAAPSSHY